MVHTVWVVCLLLMMCMRGVGDVSGEWDRCVINPVYFGEVGYVLVVVVWA